MKSNIWLIVPIKYKIWIDVWNYINRRTRRLVTLAGDRLEGGEAAKIKPLTKIEEPQVTEQPLSAPVTEVYMVPVKEKPLGTTPPRAVKERPLEAPLKEPLGSDFGLYICEACGKMVMRFEKYKCTVEAHRGKKGSGRS